jgi:hypothetical protein
MSGTIRPKTFAHVVYRTYRFQQMLDWYVKVFDGKVQYQVRDRLRHVRPGSITGSRC